MKLCFLMYIISSKFSSHNLKKNYNYKPTFLLIKRNCISEVGLFGILLLSRSLIWKQNIECLIVTSGTNKKIIRKQLFIKIIY